MRRSKNDLLKIYNACKDYVNMCGLPIIIELGTVQGKDSYKLLVKSGNVVCLNAEGDFASVYDVLTGMAVTLKCMAQLHMRRV